MFDIDTIIRDWRVTLSSSALLVILFISGQWSSPLHITFLVLLSLFLSLIAFHFIRHLKVAVRQNDGDRYYSTEEITTDHAALPIALFLTLFWTFFFVTMSVGISDATLSLEFVNVGYWGLFLILAPSVLLLGAILLFDEGSQTYRKYAFQNFYDLVLFYLTGLTIVGFMLGALMFSTYSLLGFLIGLMVLPAFLYVGYVEGRFQTVYLISNWFSFRGWDMVEEEEIAGTGTEGLKQKLSGVLGLKEIVVLPIVLIGLGRTIAVSSGLAPPASNSANFWLTLLMGVSAVLSLLVHPRSTLTTWANQGLFSKLFSGWDYYDARTNEKRSGSTTFIPTEEEVEDNRILLTLMTVVITSILGIQVLGSVYSSLGQSGLIWEVTSILTLTFAFSFFFGLVSSLLVPAGILDLVSLTRDNMENNRQNLSMLMSSEELSVTGKHSEIRTESVHSLAEMHRLLNNPDAEDEERYQTFLSAYNSESSLHSERFISLTELTVSDANTGNFSSAVERCTDYLEQNKLSPLFRQKTRFLLSVVQILAGDLDGAWELLSSSGTKNPVALSILEGIAKMSNRVTSTNFLPAFSGGDSQKLIDELRSHFHSDMMNKAFPSVEGYLEYVTSRLSTA